MLALTGCAFVSAAEEQLRLSQLDGDGDGYDAVAYGGDDCDDADDAVHPDAVEVCNERDDDCDEAIDEAPAALVAYYADVDGDAFGDPTSRVDGCAAPSGYVADDTDCDDASAAINPDAVEVCNGSDDDCDELVDDDDPSVDDPSTWHHDVDGDGHGDPESTFLACDPPDDGTEAALADDCDDSDATRAPGAEELCDGVDHDCDGQVDRGTAWVCASLAYRIAGESAGGRFGHALIGGFNIDGTPLQDLVVGAPEVAFGGLSAGAVYLLPGPLVGDATAPFGRGARWDGEAEDRLGGVLAAIPSELGAAEHLVAGLPAGDGRALVAALTGVWSTGPLPVSAEHVGFDAQELGFAVAPAPGSGGTGVVITGLPSGGRAVVVRDPLTSSSLAEVGGAVSGLSVDAPDTGVLDGLGATAATVDLDGDALPELILTSSGGAAGELVVIDGALLATDGALSVDAADARVVGTAGEGFGSAIAVVSGLSGARVIVGAPTASSTRSNQGAVYVFEADALVSLVGATPASDVAASVLTGSDTGEHAGQALSASNQLPDDVDLVVGAPGWRSDRGAVYWLSSDMPCATCALEDVAVRFVGDAEGDAFGFAVAAAGEVDDRSETDFVVGAPEHDEVGAVYVFDLSDF
jgi:hypothetical protein